MFDHPVLHYTCGNTYFIILYLVVSYTMEYVLQFIEKKLFSEDEENVPIGNDMMPNVIILSATVQEFIYSYCLIVTGIVFIF